MNYAENNQEQADFKPQTESSPAVLARVPWLESVDSEPSVAATSLENFVVDEAALMDDAWLAPHQVVASPNWNNDNLPSDSPTSAPRLVRIDPPQPLPGVAALNAAQAPVEQTVQPPAESDLQPFEEPVVRPVTADGGITHLRFDPPVQREASAAEETFDYSAPSPASWHQSVATIDNVVRQYHRVIVLAALLTAAGLMMLVLEAQQSEGEPAPDGVTPAALDTSGIAPLPLADAEPQRSTTPPQVAETVATAKGPRSDTKRPPSTNAELECIPLQPLEPYREPRVDVAALPSIEPEQAAEEQPTAGDIQTDSQPTSLAGAYPSTGAEEYAWPSGLERSVEQPQTGPTPNVARLSRELKAPSQQAK